MVRKIILITGSTDGIGKMTALKLAASGHHICIHGRNAEKVMAVIKEVKQLSGNARVDGIVADLSDLLTVEKMVLTLITKLPRLDVLINNAGVFVSPVEYTPQGLDIRFAVNYFAPYLLTYSLLPHLKKSHDARVLNLSSAAQTSVSLQALQGDVQLNDSVAYSQSKLALTMWSRQLAKQQPDITVITVNPGSLLNTNMVNQAYKQKGIPVTKGANILAALATELAYREMSGQYYDNDHCRFTSAHPDVYDESITEAFMTTSKKILLNLKENL